MQQREQAIGLSVDNHSRPLTLPPDGNGRPATGRSAGDDAQCGRRLENALFNSDGMDPGDVDELARRVASHEVDVAALQEVRAMDVPELERQLEQITGDEWDLHFAQASTKVRCDDDNWGTLHLGQPFGNVIAVRLGDGVARSEPVGERKLDAPGDEDAVGSGGGGGGAGSW